MKLLRRKSQELEVSTGKDRYQLEVHPWEAVIAALIQRASELKNCGVIIVNFETRNKRRQFFDRPSILVGRLDPIIGPSSRPFSIRVSGEPEVGSLTEALTTWEQSGYRDLSDDEGFTFASSPLDLESLAHEIARAISILEIFYEVDRKKRVDGSGDPRLIELLGFQAKR